MHKLDKDSRNDIVDKILQDRELVRKKEDGFWGNLAFYSKWGNTKWYSSESLQLKRVKAYKERYNMGEFCWVANCVKIVNWHKTTASIKIGSNVTFADNVDIDYTGGLIIGNGVQMAEGVKILTHGHMYLGNRKDYIDDNNTYATPLIIENNVFIGVHSIIMPGVKSIGENSIISAGAIVTRPVPANSLVSGNPATFKPIPVGMRTLYMWKND